VLDFQGGGSLASLLRTRPVLAPGEIVTVAAPLAEALAEVHGLGMVHGDLSPANVLFSTDGRPMLADLGVARLVRASTNGGVTAAFADPSVLDGAPFTPASDVYALAAICFTALTGAPPLTGDGASGRPPLSGLAPTVPRAMAELVESALAPDVAGRPDAATFAARLLASAPALPVRLAGATVPVDSPPTAAARRLPAPPPVEVPVPSRGERLAALLGRLRVTPRRFVACVAAPAALGAAVWGGVAWARSSSAGAPAWTLTAPAGSASVSAQGPLGRPGTPDPGPDQAAGARSSSPRASGSTRPGDAAPRADSAPATTRAVPTPRSASAPSTAAADASVGRAAPNARAGTNAGAATSGGAATTALVSRLTEVLRRLDSARAVAFETSSPAALDGVYVAGSAPLRADERLLAAMTSAGDHAAGLRLDVRRVTVVATHARSADLQVTDTLPSYQLVSTDGTRVRVAGRGEATWRIRLVQTGAGWRIGAITAAPR
jgi:hypothetical protein